MSINQLLKLIFAMSVVILNTCTSALKGTRNSSESSDLSAITIKLPDKSKLDSNVQDKVTGAHLSIKSKVDTCMTPIDQSTELYSGALSQRLKQACDYSVLLELGKIDSSSSDKKLSVVYYSNDPDKAAGQPLLSSDLKGKSSINFKVNMQLTQQGRDEGLPNLPFGDSSSGDGRTGYDPMKEITFTEIQDYGGAEKITPLYMDVIGHTDPNGLNPRSRGLAFDTYSVRIHETCHMLNSQVANNQSGIQGAYYGDGKGVQIKSNGPKISAFRNQVPAFLKQNGDYNLYLVSQPSGQPSLDRLSYLFDEWSAYLKNGKLSQELEIVSRPESQSSSSGRANDNAHAFFGYLATGMHYMVQTNDATLNDKQFAAAFALFAEDTFDHARRSENSTDLGPNIKKMLDFYRNSPDFEPIRVSLRKIYGDDWLQRLTRT